MLQPLPDLTICYKTKYDSLHYGSWDAFQKVFIETFCPENESTHALMHLESDRYFQGKRTVNTYVNEFEDLNSLHNGSIKTALQMKPSTPLEPSITL